MQIQYQRNVQFTRLLKVDGRLKEFNFRRVGNGILPTYTVDVSDDKGNRIMMKVEKDGEWKISNPETVPNWVLKQESQFHQIIESHIIEPDQDS